MSKLNLYFAELPSFDDLKNLALNNPEAFEAFKQYHCQSYINSLPDERQHRMKCVQNRVNNELNRSTNPVYAVVRLSNMMHQSLKKMADGLNGNIDPESLSVPADNVTPFIRPNA